MKITIVPKSPTRQRGPRKVRLYIWPDNESIIDQLYARHHRPHDQWKKLIPSILEKLPMPAHMTMYLIDPRTPAKWSQKAGCSCPCSPGFILDCERPFDIHVKLEAADIKEAA